MLSKRKNIVLCSTHAGRENEIKIKEEGEKWSEFVCERERG